MRIKIGIQVWENCPKNKITVCNDIPAFLYLYLRLYFCILDCISVFVFLVFFFVFLSFCHFALCSFSCSRLTRERLLSDRPRCKIKASVIGRLQRNFWKSQMSPISSQSLNGDNSASRGPFGLPKKRKIIKISPPKLWACQIQSIYEGLVARGL